MIEVSRARHVGAHTVKPCFALSPSEIQFVLNFPGLNHLEQLVWIVLASLNNENADFATHFSFQDFSHMLGKHPSRVARAIAKLRTMGIVQQDMRMPERARMNFANRKSSLWRFLCLFVKRRGRMSYGEMWGMI